MHQIIKGSRSKQVDVKQKLCYALVTECSTTGTVAPSPIMLHRTFGSCKRMSRGQASTHYLLLCAGKEQEEHFQASQNDLRLLVCMFLVRSRLREGGVRV